MDGFKKLPKMQHFKEGGGVKNAYCGGGKAYKKGGEVHDKADEKEDKKLIKKAFAMHDKQEHEGEKTDLSKLKKGGRSKKAVGTVKKFEKKEAVVKKKEGGTIGMKKTADDKKKIATIKKEKAEKLCGGGKTKKYAEGRSVTADDIDLKKIKPVEMPRGGDGGLNIPGYGKVKPVEMPRGGDGGLNIPGYGKVKPVEMPTASKNKKGGKIKKKAEGGAIEEGGKAGLANVPKPNLIDSAKDTVNRIGKRLYENVMGTPEQNAAAQARLDKYEASKKGTPVSKKKGGAIKKFAEGSLTGDVGTYDPSLQVDDTPAGLFGGNNIGDDMFGSGPIDQGVSPVPVMYNMGSPMVGGSVMDRLRTLNTAPQAGRSARPVIQKPVVAQRPVIQKPVVAQRPVIQRPVNDRFRPERNKGGASLQPTPLPVTQPVRDIGLGNVTTPTYGGATNNPILPDVPGGVKEVPVVGQPLVTPAVKAPAVVGNPNPMNGQFAAMKRGGKAKGKKK